MNQETSLTRHAYDALVIMLDDGRFAENARLPSEDRMAKELGISRPVLRLALERLRTENRIVSRKGSGHYVQSKSAPPPAIAYGSLAGISDVRDFLMFRMTIETEGAALAASVANEGANAAIDGAQQRMLQAFDERRPGVDEDIAFHIAIAHASGNRFYALTMESLADQMRLSVRLIRDLSAQTVATRKEAIIREHGGIVQAIAQRDPERARQAMRAHLLGGIERLFGERG
ncbi:GntR family transcriptional regulator [Caballeronia glebae]|uniref:GntR family transcriptional regulator n=1 Tax=Caballeronia glebae TaxID=1777143 RepID=A0A158A459_9BURK|nr:FadR/GntR family transcriptional regulator [Caballeronia glebae]SAK52489.1 GntR family transcriptional regulator [Caballeronia glebae]